MKVGVRVPSLKRRIAARTSWKRVVRHELRLKAPRGYGWLTNPHRAAYNRVYNRTTVSADQLLRHHRRGMYDGRGLLLVVLAAVLGLLAGLLGARPGARGSRG